MRYVVKRREPWFRVFDVYTGRPCGRHFDSEIDAMSLARKLNLREFATLFPPPALTR